MGKLTPREAVMGYIKAFRSGNIDAVVEALDPDIVVYESPATPFPKPEYRGHAGYREMNAFFRGYWAETGVGEPGRIVADDEVAILVGTLLGRPKGSDKWIRVPVMERFKVVNGLITEIWPYYFDPTALPGFDERNAA